MIDVGLLISLVVIGVTMAGVRRWVPPYTLGSESPAGVSAAAVWAGLVVARLVAVGLDDPRALARPRDLMLIRSGMEFWAGAIVGLAVAAVGARRAGAQPLARLADLSVYGLVAYGTYEAMCLVRDGCFGPVAGIGLRPRGVGDPQIPIGLLVAAAVWALSALVRATVPRAPGRALLIAAGGLGCVRLAASLLLPRIGTGLGRSEVESIAVVATATTAGAAQAVRARHRRSPSTSATDLLEGSGGTSVVTAAPPAQADDAEL